MTTKILIFFQSHAPKHLFDILSMHHYQVSMKEASSEYLHVVESHDLVIFYDIDSLDLLSLMKEHSVHAYLPTIVISKSTVVSKHIEALHMGADDFIHTSENSQIVMARIERMLSRYRHVLKKQSGSIKFQHLEMNLKTSEVKLDGKIAPITFKEFELLRLFVSNPGKTLSKEDIYKVIWRHAEVYSENVINVHIRHLRKKIEKNASIPEIIMTVWGFGYRLGEGELRHI